MLTPDEILRYKRHLVLKEIGGEGQQKLKASRVLIVGAGGLGSPLMLYLAAAGVGAIGVIDDDRVSIDNLQRQIAHRHQERRQVQDAERRRGHRAHQPACRDAPLHHAPRP